MMVLLTLTGTSAAIGLVPTATAGCGELGTYSVGVTYTCESSGAYTWAGTCDGIGVGAGTNGKNACVSVSTCTSSGLGGIGVQVGNQCVGITQYSVTSCALYADNTNAPPTGPLMYPGHTGIVFDDTNPGYHPSDSDVALCFKTCPAAAPYGVVMNNVQHCSGAPTTCPGPGTGGLSVGVNGTCIALPWVGFKPGPAPLTPSPCAGTVGVTVYWGDVGGAPWTVVCI